MPELNRMAGRTVAPEASPAATERARPRASLSVVVMTAGPGPRVAAILELLRSVAQEIIVALDDRAADDVRDDLASVADRVIAYPFLEPVDRPLPWLFHECRSEWMLTLDDDEVPSVALLDALPSLLDDDRVVHYSLSRRWVYPDVRTYLTGPPWQPDYQLRLFRTDPRLIRFSDALHTPIVARGPGRFVREPIWHLDTILRSAAERRGKADRYEAARPGVRVGGRALNYAFYVPEARADARLEQLPNEERTLLDLVLAAERPQGPPRARLEHVTREEIDRHWPVTPERQTGELHVPDPPAAFLAHEERAVDVVVRNTGEEPWQWGRAALPTVRCASRWDDDRLASAIWTPLPSVVAPGESIVVPVHVRAPATPGRHRLVLDLVHEGVRWFGCDVTCDVEVQPRKRFAFLDVEPETIRDALAADPEIEPIVIGVGHGYPQTASPEAFLLAPAPAGRVAFSAVYALRAARLLVGAPLPPAGRAFREALKSCTEVVAGPPRGATRRERWTHALTLLTARRLGVRVTRVR
jgi:hypothetical protein